MSKDIIEKILIPYWMRNPDHFEFQISVRTNKIFIDPQGNPHAESALRPLNINMSVVCEVMPELPKEEIIGQMVENMASTFQMALVKEITSK